MILVTSAFGTQGQLLIPKLAAAGLEVRAMRNRPRPDELRALGAADVVIGDAADPRALRDAMEGSEIVYHIGPSAHLHEREMGLAMVDAARDAGVRHVVFSSVLHPIVTELVQHDLKRDVEERLVSSGLNFTILQPSDYMQNLPPTVFETGRFKIAWSLERLQAMIDVDDLTDVAVKVLAEGKAHYGATYELSSENLSAHDISAAISRAIGRPVVPTQIAPDALLAALLQRWNRDGTSGQERLVVESFCRWYDTHDFLGNSNVLEMLLGRTPTTYEAFARRQYAAYAAA